jgi:sodium:dicarboxylate symporter family protein
MAISIDEAHEAPRTHGRLWSVVAPLVVLASFALGMLLANRAPAAARWSGEVMDALVGVYGDVAPLVIFFTAVPLLSRVRRRADQQRWIGVALRWLAWKRLVTCVFGAVFTWLVFGFAVLPSHGVRAPEAALIALLTLVRMATTSPYFLAVYAGVAVSIVVARLPRVTALLERFTAAIERAGGAFRYGIPPFMFFLGAYLYNLPKELAERMDGRVFAHATLALRVGRVDIGGPGGIVLAYVIVSALVGVACLAFHAASLYRLRRAVPGFSIRHYVVDYWLAIYPFLWASCSESLGTPLNLHLVRRHYPEVPSELRLFVIGIGGWLNLNGTMICAFLMAGAVARIVGHDLSLLELLLAIPIVFLIGYVTPGLPGELIPFAAPMAAALHIPGPLVAPFVAVYIGFNFGLPDAFRTGQNSTDNCVSALHLIGALDRRRASFSGVERA